MKPKAYFVGIRETIIQHLEGAEESVLVAVAWLTDETLFDSLVSCQRRGVAVSLAVLDDHTNRRSWIAWERLTILGGQLFWLPEGTAREGSLHHKFCLIDNDTVINGSFNWTYRARSADENITVFKGDATFAEQFQQEFVQLLNKHGYAAGSIVIDRARLLSRLSVIAELLELEDFDDLPAQARKLNYAKSIEDIAHLILQLNQRDWANAKHQVNRLLARVTSVPAYEDPMIEEYRWQVRLLAIQALMLGADLAVMQKQIRLFECQEDLTNGHMFERYLDAKRRYLAQVCRRNGQRENRQEAKAAEDAYVDYVEARAARSAEQDLVRLDQPSQADLKQFYRKFSMQNHPDCVEQGRARAKVLLEQIGADYRKNDPLWLQELKIQIEQFLGLADNALMPDQADQLQYLLTVLNEMVHQLTEQLAALTQSITWQTLTTQPDWDMWFADQAGQIKTEIEYYQRLLNRSQLKAFLRAHLVTTRVRVGRKRISGKCLP